MNNRRSVFGLFAGLVAALLGRKAAATDGPAVGPQVAPMPEERFWSIVERTRAAPGEQDRQVALLKKELSPLAPADIAGFQAAFDHQMSRAYSWDLWGAAYVVEGGVSDDGFDYFRRWLIAQGRAAFEHALQDPESLAELIAPDADDPPEFEEFGYAAADVWARKTKMSAQDMPVGGDVLVRESAGRPFEEDEEALAHRYPRLWKRFGAHPLG